MDFKIELFECQEQKILEIYWRCKRHPHWNTASIKPKVAIATRHLRYEESFTKFCSFFQSWNGPRAIFFRPTTREYFIASKMCPTTEESEGEQISIECPIDCALENKSFHTESTRKQARAKKGGGSLHSLSIFVWKSVLGRNSCVGIFAVCAVSDWKDPVWISITLISSRCSPTAAWKRTICIEQVFLFSPNYFRLLLPMQW